MASGGREDHVHKKFSPTTPHFFKIILEDTLRNNKLQIPKRIVTKLCGSGSLPNHAFLKLPRCGSLRWEVGLTKCDDGKVWIDKDWKEFRDYCSLVRGNLLVFRYEGNSQFSVLIFDSSTMEIEYNHPSNSKFLFHEKHEFSGAHKRGRTSSLGKTQSNMNHPHPRPTVMFHISPDKAEAAGEKIINISPPKWRKCDEDGIIRRKRLTEKEKAQALKRARSFKSKHPFLMVVMQPSFVQGRYLMNLPRVFTRKYLRKGDEVILKAADHNRTWLVKFGVYNGNYPKARFETGWRQFARDNNLKVGDVCVFVLTKRIRILFEVTIFRENGIANSTLFPGPRGRLISSKVEPRNTVDEKARADLEGASGFRSGNPFFTVAMPASYVSYKGSFHIPCNFAKTYIDENEVDTILEVSDGRSWPVLYRVRGRSLNKFEAEFCRGWNAFTHDNSLEEGDICTFELMHGNGNGNDMLFKVSIVKAHSKGF